MNDHDYEAQHKVWIESEPFRWLGRAILAAVIVGLLAVWWSSIAPAQAQESEKLPKFQFTFACNATHCVMPKVHLELLFAANKDLADKLSEKRAAECPSRPTPQLPEPPQDSTRGSRT